MEREVSHVLNSQLCTSLMSQAAHRSLMKHNQGGKGAQAFAIILMDQPPNISHRWLFPVICLLPLAVQHSTVHRCNPPNASNHIWECCHFPVLQLSLSVHPPSMRPFATLNPIPAHKIQHPFTP